MASHKKRQARRLKRKRERKPQNENRGVEFAAEAGMLPLAKARSDSVEGTKIDQFSAVGAFAVIFSIISLILFPVPMGLSGAGLGALAYVQGSRTSGIFAIVIGLFSAMVRLVLLSFYG
ncbi:hypothetical protein [Paenibacillus apiarius]|uniref:hypothetical protein n=1 Tax=Paenibacillus apiarius TaxID=46240 RepID=UPI001980B511|nr:hypothetical protein [Paenibacillus apiarius]MBN3525931.1 hypothetical protein [Paenibacillus apiarius]